MQTAPMRRGARPPALRSRGRPLLVDEIDVARDLGMEPVPDAEQAFDLEPGSMREHRLLRVDLEHAIGDALGAALAAPQESDQVVADPLLAEKNPHLPIRLVGEPADFFNPAPIPYGTFQPKSPRYSLRNGRGEAFSWR
jgi:hypothetical protein